MSASYVEEMRRRLHIRILLSRMGCFTELHQDQLSTQHRFLRRLVGSLSTPDRAV
jgi:hypothetical protein